MNRQSEALNKEYFQALGSTRASVRMLSLAWAGLFVLSIDLTDGSYPTTPLLADRF